MTTFHLRLEGDILKVGFGDPGQGDQIVRDVAMQLDDMLSAQKFACGPLLKINGRSSVLVSYVIAHKLAHLYGAIAVFDPKIGERGLDRYVITISHTPAYRIGDVLDLSRPKQTAIKVVICGPKNTGKSCLREGLKQALLHIPDAPDSYVVSGCPDGDGSWFSETARRDPQLASQLKAEYKAKFTPEFAQQKAREIRVINTPLLVFDVGGKISPENQQIMAGATHAVILVRAESQVAEWQEFCESLNLNIVAILTSDYEGNADQVGSELPLRGSVHRLERGEDIATRTMVEALATLLARLV